MKFNKINTELQKEIKEMLENAEDKGAAIYEAIEKLNAAAHEDLIKQLQEEDEELRAGRATAEKLGLRTSFSADEKAFYAGIQQSVTFTQEDVIPTEIIDRTLEDVKAESSTMKLVTMAPAGVKKWLTGSHSGAGAWGALTDALTAELTAAIKSIAFDVNKAYVLLVVPKAVRDLGMPLVDKYFSAILAEAMRDVLIKGYLAGTGAAANMPVGLLYNLPNSSGAVTAKTVISTVTNFSPAKLAPVKTKLSNNGKRAITKLYLIANPTDVYTYVDPALYAMNIAGTYVKACKDDIEVIEEPNMTAGTAIFTIENTYTMGMTSVEVNEYNEIKALDDADLFIGKCYANGRPDDDNTAVPFNVTKLEEFKFQVETTEVTA